MNYKRCPVYHQSNSLQKLFCENASRSEKSLGLSSEIPLWEKFILTNTNPDAANFSAIKLKGPQSLNPLNPCEIIIADEPTTALDVVVQRGVVQLLKEIQNELNNTIVLVTHDMGVHANIADRIGIMYAGKIVEEADTETIFKAPKHPYTQYLINSLPQFGDKSVRKSVPGSPPSLDRLPEGCSFNPRCPHASEICYEKVPEGVETDNGHKVACWL